MSAAKTALARADVTPVLKWVLPEHEAGMRDAFAQALEVRGAGGSERDLADRRFFETVVRLHCEAEGVPDPGFKPERSDLRSGIAAADRALQGGSVDDLLRLLESRGTAGLRERYARVIESGRHAEESVQVGREYVQACVEFIH